MHAANDRWRHLPRARCDRKLQSSLEFDPLMCGIHGVFYFDPHRPVEEPLLLRMRKIAAHRGPDDHGTYRSHNVGLAANRLSIVDIPGGHQPMANNDGSVW